MNGLLSFLFVEKGVICQTAKYENIFRNTFMQYLPRLTQLVKEKIATMLSERICIVLTVGRQDRRII